jgi:endonuclease/exonuclease/phosphatase family metal-dependent hydrolase
MSYNVLGGTVPDDWFPLLPRDQLPPMVRAPSLVAKIESAHPDVAGFQELIAGTELSAYLEQKLVGYTWVHSSDNHALMVRRDRFDVDETGESRLNSVGEEGSYLDRYVNWARLRDRSSRRTVLVLNVHAHPVQTVQMARVRALGITRLVAVVRELDPKLAEPLVLMGDFNAGDKESRPVFRDHLTALSELGLADTAALAARDASDVPNANSLNKLTAQVAGVEVAKVVRRTARHVDYVWVPSRTEVSTWQVLSGPGVRWQRVRGERVPTWPGIIASDHSPVIAEFTFG